MFNLFSCLVYSRTLTKFLKYSELDKVEQVWCPALCIFHTYKSYGGTRIPECDVQDLVLMKNCGVDFDVLILDKSSKLLPP